MVISGEHIRRLDPPIQLVQQDEGTLQPGQEMEWRRYADEGQGVKIMSRETYNTHRAAQIRSDSQPCWRLMSATSAVCGGFMPCGETPYRWVRFPILQTKASRGPPNRRCGLHEVPCGQTDGPGHRHTCFFLFASTGPQQLRVLAATTLQMYTICAYTNGYKFGYANPHCRQIFS